MAQKTIIMITHRLHSIVDADVIYVLKDGKVAVKGKHNELINNSIYYKKMFERNMESDLGVKNEYKN
jgi:ABC-type multidrug transport system fused ATPase/permease subunit